MQHSKGIKNISELSKYSESVIQSSLMGLIGKLDLRYINKLFCSAKSKGASCSSIFQILFLARFLDFSNVFQLMSHGISKEVGFERDVLYSFLKNERINWRKILYLFYRQIVKLIERNSNADTQVHTRYFIVDDSTLEKTGKTIEFIGKVYDHCLHNYKLGMKLLTLGIWDGKNFMPLDFSIHNEPGKKGNRGLRAKELKAQYIKNRAADAASSERIQEVSEDKIENSIKMVGRAIKKGIKADYVLTDSWFVCERFISRMLAMHLHTIGLMKTNRKVTIQGKTYMAKHIPEIKRKLIKANTKLKCKYISVLIEYKGIEMRAYWVKMNGQNSWKMLISTDCTLTFTQAMKHYQARWTIEVFFKDCKQKLHLNACQSTDLDAHIATISIVFMNYMLIACRKRFDDYEPIGGIFTLMQEEILEDTLLIKLWNIFIELYTLLFAPLGVDWELFVENIILNKNKIADLFLEKLECLFYVKNKAA